MKVPFCEKRRCLRCQKMFSSTGPGNRICGDCTAKNSKISTISNRRSKMLMRSKVSSDDR